MSVYNKDSLNRQYVRKQNRAVQRKRTMQRGLIDCWKPKLQTDQIHDFFDWFILIEKPISNKNESIVPKVGAVAGCNRKNIGVCNIEKE